MPCIGPERPTDNCGGYGAYGDCRFERRDDHLRPADGILPPEEGGVGIPPSPSDSKEAADRRRGTPAESSIERSVRRGGMRAQMLLVLRIRKLQPWISELRWLAIARDPTVSTVAVGKVLSKRSDGIFSLLDLHEGSRANAQWALSGTGRLRPSRGSSHILLYNETGARIPDLSRRRTVQDVHTSSEETQ